MENIPADYWLILCHKSYWPAWLPAGTLRWTFRPACPSCPPAFPVMAGLSSRRCLPEAQSSR